uniref:Tubulin--tyrosine ligase-like protein 12 SET-like domain-containing protein n=1 Tax=Timema poppense TaxID=170557 RepID=A0A7R9CTU6_TIMPO|nr:unnamed protein product [Timema poppensis]
MKSLMGICDNLTTEDTINVVFDEMWKFNQTYSVGSLSNVESRLPVWYIMDEFGSAIQHAEEPNFRVVPLIYLPEQIPYSLLFPIKNLSKDEEVTRDFIEGPIRTPLDRRVLLLPWEPISFISEDFQQEEPDLLSIVCRRSENRSKTMDPESLEMYPLWLPVTYNLKTELTKFVSYFQHRENKGLDNHWICKPWNLARGLDIHITNNVNYIVRLPFTGPKIAQKYIEDPVLFNRPDCGLVKFDIRYVLLVKSIQPLEAYVYRNFFLRFANKPFELNDFDIYDKHFTVMNYTEHASLYMKLCDEFIEDFQMQYAGHQWEMLEKKIFSMFLEILEAATCKQPPLSIGHNPQSRALYAADIMLAWRTDEDGCRWPRGLRRYSRNRLAADDREIRVQSQSSALTVAFFAKDTDGNWLVTIFIPSETER